MKCEEVRDELVAYARGELDETRQAAVEEHLVRCQGCTKELEGARQVLALTQMADDASIRDLAHELIRAALAQRASDFHLEMADGAPRTRLRIDGVLRPGPAVTREQYQPLVARFKIMAEMHVSERQLPQDGRVAVDHEGKEYDLRVATYPYFNGEGVVIRILDKSSVPVIGLNKLGLSPKTLAQIEAMVGRPHGIIFAAGPTGAGKSTLLYSILNRLNRPEVKILTIEDPVEYLIPGLNQAAVNRRAGVGFANTLRAFMRQDPDIIMVGEIRDLETLEMAVQAAVTGHLMLSVVHTPDATSALTRLLDVGIAPFILATTLIGVIGQRLGRTICPDCKEPYQPAEARLEALGFTPKTRPETFFHGAGCDQCRRTGYRGRVGLFEVLTLSEELARMIAEAKSEISIRARALELDLLWPFIADARAKVAEGITTAEEVERVLLGIPSARPR